MQACNFEHKDKGVRAGSPLAECQDTFVQSNESCCNVTNTSCALVSLSSLKRWSYMCLNYYFSFTMECIY